MMRNLRASLLFAVVEIVTLLSSSAATPAVAPNTCSAKPCTIANLFDPDLADLKYLNNQELDSVVQAMKDANKANDRGCYPPSASITVFAPPLAPPSQGYPSTLIADARATALIDYFSGKGLVQGTDYDISKIVGQSDKVEVQFNGVDRDPPVLKTNSDPPKNTKVKAGDQIKVHATASERYEDGHKSSPTGVKSIQLIANGILFDSKDFGMKPPPCKVQPFEPIYTVPKNPPPVVHLRIYTEDATGHGTFEEADFPTEDWYGTLREHAQGNIYNDTVYVDFSFSEERDGTIKGTGRVDKMTSEPQLWTGCTSTRTLKLKPGEAEFPISGKRVGDEFQLDLPTDRRLTMNIKTDCPPPRRSGTTEGRRSLGMSETFYHPKVKAKDGATNEFHKPGALKVDGWIEIHRAKQ